MSKTKSNVHPGHYKVAGRGRQGEDVIHDRQKAMLAESQAIHEHQGPYPEHVAALEDKQSPEREALESARRAEAQRRSPSRQATRGRHKPGRKPAPKASRAVSAGKAARARTQRR